MTEELPQCAQLTVTELAQSLKSRLTEGPPFDPALHAVWHRVTCNHAWCLAHAALGAALALERAAKTELLETPTKPKVGPR